MLGACCCRGNNHKNVDAAAWEGLLQGRRRACLLVEWKEAGLLLLVVAMVEVWPGGASGYC